VVTSEADPLAIFGAGASRVLRDLLSDRGIRLRMGADVRGLAPGRLELDVGGPVEVDAVVALPRLEGPHVAGLPCDAEGFIPIDEHCRVTGLDDVYAAGDGTTFPIKQGGIATQQADVASESIAADLGALSSPSTFEPMLRGMLLTGVAPMYLRASAGTGAGGDEVAGNALWWPPTKIAGRHLGPYLTYACSLQRHVPLEDHPVSPRSLEAVEASHDEARDLALALAKVDALSGDFASALSWLEVIERLDGVLSSSCIQLRAEWQARAS
jgi:sulfide:quinone oxidoreductase